MKKTTMKAVAPKSINPFKKSYKAPKVASKSPAKAKAPKLGIKAPKKMGY